MIFGNFGRKRKNRAIVDELYRQLTLLARNPEYYSQMNVPDSVMGRFEMLSLIMVVFFRRTDSAGQAVKQLAQDMVDTFFEDIDHSLRELGIGDVSVPKRMKKLARMFYGRANAYGEAFGHKDVILLSAALERNIHPERQRDETTGQGSVDTDMRALATAAINLDLAMAQTTEAELLEGQLSLPNDLNVGSAPDSVCEKNAVDS